MSEVARQLPPQECFRLDEAVPLLGIQIPTIRKRIATGKLTARREGRVLIIDREEIDRYKAARPAVAPKEVC